MKNYIIKRYLKYLGIIPNNCVYCLKDLEIEKLKINQDKDLQQNFDFEYICKDCLKKYLNKFNVCIDKISINKNTIIKHIYLGEYNKIKDEIMDIKYFDKRYILKSIIEINSKDILKEIIYNSTINSDKNNKNKNEDYEILMIYIPTTLKKYLERGNISKYICKCLKYEFEKIIVKMMGKTVKVKIFNIAKIVKDIEIKKLNKEERKLAVNKKYSYLKYNKMEKYITKILENEIEKDISYKIIIVDDVYTTGATMKKITQMINQNIMVDRLNNRKNFEYIFFSLAKD